MEYAELGKSGLKISRISMGCMSLPADEITATPIIHRALDLGINYFDTADIYDDGQNEIILGKAFRNKRERVLLASKAGNVRRPDGGLDWNPTAKHILKCIESSLRRLNTDYIDVYQLHGGTINDNIDETIETFEKIKKEGKIRHYGISSIRPNVISEYIRKSSIVSVMMQYSLLDRRPEEECLDLLYKNNIGVLVRGALAQGLLVNKPARQYLDHAANEVARAADAVKLAAKGERTSTHTAIQYVLQNKAVTSAVIGMRTMSQLEEAVSTLDIDPLDQDEITALKKSVPATVYKEHRSK